MVNVLIACNLLFSSFGFYLTWRLWQWRGQLADFNRDLIYWERSSRRCLPEFRLLLAMRRLELLSWRDRYRYWQGRWQSGQQVLLLVSLLLRARRR